MYCNHKPSIVGSTKQCHALCREMAISCAKTWQESLAGTSSHASFNTCSIVVCIK
jgi:hypothetical protein